MRILSIGLFLLLGACSVADAKAPAVENYGGDINSPLGQAWLDNTLRKGKPWTAVIPNGSWVRDNDNMQPDLGTGNIGGFGGTQVPGIYVFVGALSPTTALYRSPRFQDSGMTIEGRVEGFFISNTLNLDNNSNTILIYPADLKLTDAETNAIAEGLGILNGVAAASAELQKRYNDIVHVPSNYDFTKPIEKNGAHPQAIIVLAGS